MNFKQRQNFVLDDASLTLDDYKNMRQINRCLLTFFLQDWSEAGIELAVKRFSETISLDSADQNWADEHIDEELKKLLQLKMNGAFLTVDLTAHMEYFYNTLDCDNRTENPFRSPSKFLALLYQVSSSSGMSNSTPASKVSLL